MREVNEIFSEKGLKLALPYPDNWLVSDMKVIEKRREGNIVHVLLALKLIDDKGRELSDIYYGESEIKRKKIHKEKLLTPLKRNMLPERTEEFKNERDVMEYLKNAFLHLLEDKGYNIEEGESKICGEKKGRKFFGETAPSFKQSGEKIEKLMKLRDMYGSSSDYGIVLPAFQEQFGASFQEFNDWLLEANEMLSEKKIGVYAVSNKNPNLIFSLLSFPMERELRTYFMRTTGHWSSLKDELRKKRR